jgi:hypothetical protein
MWTISQQEISQIAFIAVSSFGESLRLVTLTATAEAAFKTAYNS